MTYLILSILLWIWDNRSFEQISQKNVARQKAQSAYEKGRFREAVEQYELLIRSSMFVEPSARLDLAHAYYQLERYEEAKRYYQQVAKVKKPELSAAALVQLGIIACQQTDSATALSFFRQALNVEPRNTKAQFDYELIRKSFSGKKPPQKNSRQKQPMKANASSSEKELAAGQPNGGNEVEKNDSKAQLLRRLRSLNLSEEQVIQLLNSLQENEVQYIQQRKSSNPSADSRRDFKSW
ncbi:tetratricopeptide repeat protein [Tellurirhabdus bombi]|uniref:tetratricopeptide repeat protein n=1 Tax=Tellurirhabdus bombi TaxID=2907205 RepID=UPI001F456CC3|nr:tetratricopeptide repeat protein [Tellurirhabdus bombi]